MDYRICNVYVIILMHAYTHSTLIVSQHFFFYSEKLSQIVLMLLTGFKSQVMESTGS